MNEVTVIHPQASSGQAGCGTIIDYEFGSATDLRKKLADMKQKLNLTKEFFREVMQEGVDYGIIPGTDKPTLLKPGAEGLCEFYNFAPTIASKVEDKNFETGYYGVDITIRLIHRGSGAIIGEGVGHANTFESRYRWRWVSDKDLPKGVEKEDLVSKERSGKYGKYQSYRMENDDMHSIWNTVLKMAKKRALVDATLAATRSSGIFTQTEQELEAYLAGEDPDGEGENPTQSKAQQQNTQNRQTSNRSTGTGNSGQSGKVVQKNRVLDLMKKAALDWNSLAKEATIALNRDIKKVVSDIQTDADWKTVGDHLEFLIAASQSDQKEMKFDIPENL
ncbi:hypothetical protein PAECIP111891_02152 [Paenibacillus allorhizoplanae]|uniref:Recombinase n=1 Tax=Paenibacillus allorhizoplanae TaxID=2905648 RepID=A0ABN8GDX6_9BACL|nr:hypothetical protein [Paenibacillus allorhizoplanae]CAH1202936.1 hypothetical protein PAECIP111891_02152 [Paenibacillus allorhizoplanae]